MALADRGSLYVAGREDAAVDEFVRQLHMAADATGSKSLMRATSYAVQAKDGQHTLLSWRTQEYAYRQFSQERDQLPTLSRGLFTESFKTATGEHERIVVRGYDKFFNVSELPWTQPEAIKAFSQGPYTVSYKENGCIIFISALTPDELVVTSKHAVASGDDQDEEQRTSHSAMGRLWLQRHLQHKNKSEAELARDLWTRNQTAVFELCDDQFEEHVLAYTPERSGLHLHGLNENQRDFSTQPMDQVSKFADQYGFLPVRFHVFDTLSEVDAFAQEVGQTGSLNGEPIEGFVVRTRMPDNLHQDKLCPPYAPGQTWFYKVKFDEPYLMYRDWRELTRAMIKEHSAWIAANPLAASFDHLSMQEETDAPESNFLELQAEVSQAQQQFQDGTLSKNELKRVTTRLKRKQQQKKQAKGKADRAAGLLPPKPPTPRSTRKETRLYIQWAFDRLYGNKEKGIESMPDWFAEFSKGHGIIALREHFLDYLATAQGQDALKEIDTSVPSGQDLRDDHRPFQKTLLVPIAVPGCGKTALAVALADIFACTHCQSDDVTAKRTGPTFLSNVQKALESSDVVIADRNNHLLKHRDEIVNMIRRVSGPQKNGSKGPRVRLVALNWKLNGISHAAIQHVCAMRIVDRGDRHQCLRVEDRDAPFQYDGILSRFLKELQPFQGLASGEGSTGASDDQFHDVIHMDIEHPLDVALRHILNQLCPLLNLPMPADSRIENALSKAKSYIPQTKKPLPDLVHGNPYQVYPTSYIGIFVHVDILQFVKNQLASMPTEHRLAAESFIEDMRSTGRLTSRQHITLVHRSDQDTEAGRLWDELFPIATRNVSERPMFRVTIKALVWNDSVMALEVDDILSESLHSIGKDTLLRRGRTPHITVGTRYPSTQAYEAHKLFTPNADIHCLAMSEDSIVGALGFHSNPK
ncbi:RNA ligase (ATP) [Malassezia yamatoensis]|uniref:RNA ligase (ATP) n=1 Tax=Malassezia yamatoensis TaxID=253288 RepID=A0AAJ5YV96_9BASI|nr:RNA ligase (ATP) [Malassezia yamatoensis]